MTTTIDGYYIGVRRVLTNLFGIHQVTAYATSTDKDSKNRRLFFSTIQPACLNLSCAWFEEAPMNQTGSTWMDYIPLFLYKLRWKTEVGYYEQKSFWSLCSYMVRSSKGIEMLVNLINTAYASMKLLPYKEKDFFQYQNKSTQEFRFVVSEQIREQVIFTGFAKSLENDIKLKSVINRIKQKVFGCDSAA